MKPKLLKELLGYLKLDEKSKDINALCNALHVKVGGGVMVLTVVDSSRNFRRITVAAEKGVEDFEAIFSIILL